ncbi:unnamed protein product [Urochloa humidicola]
MAASRSSSSVSSATSTGGSMANRIVVGPLVMTIDGYSKTKAALGIGGSVEFERFLIGGQLVHRVLPLRRRSTFFG